MAGAGHPTRAPLRVLARYAPRTVYLVALTLCLERVALLALTREVVAERPRLALLGGGALAGLFLLRSVARSYLRITVEGRLLATTTAALLSEHPGGGGRTEQAELALIDSLFAVEGTLADHVPALLGDGAACAVMVTFAFAALPLRFVALGLAATLVGVGAMLAGRRVASARTERVWDAYAPLLDDVSSAFRARDEIVGNGAGAELLASFARKLRRWRELSGLAALTSFLAGRAPALAVAAGAGLVLLFDQSLRGSLAHGTLARAALLASMTPPFAGVARAWLETGRTTARMRPVVDLLDSPSAPIAHGKHAPLPTALAVEHVSFRYDPDASPVLEDLVATVRPGEVTALVGPNGSGKTTLLSMLVGLVEPTCGVVSVGGIDLRLVDATGWRRSIGYLSQRPHLPERASARDAMRLVAPGADDAALQRALARVELWEVLEAHCRDAPLETKLGSLSAGERQRLALARVLARDAEVLLLDEPDANLDADGVELLASVLRQLSTSRIVVVAAHSPRLVAAADRIIQLGSPRASSAAASAPAIKAASSSDTRA